MGEFSVGTERSGFSVVVAMDRNRGIGNKGDLPWPKLKGDMKFFRELTTCPDRAAVEKRWGLRLEESAETKSWEDVSAMLKFAHPLPEAIIRNVAIMGRKTYESLPDAFRPLPGRLNISLSKATSPVSYWADDNLKRCFRFEYALEKNSVTPWDQEQLFVIGGGQIFEIAAQHQDCNHLYVTEIDAVFECDTFFPKTPDFHPVLSSPWIEENGIRYRFRRYDRT